MNNQVVFNKFAVKSGDNWVADSDLLKRTAGYKVTAEDWNSIFLILASQADNNASAVKELADAEVVRSIKVGNNTLSATDNTLELPVDVDTMQSPDNLPTVRAVKDYVKHFAMDSAGFVIDSVYPVGSIYMSVNSTSPATLFGGTWERIQDRFLFAAGSTYDANHRDETYARIDGGTNRLGYFTEKDPRQAYAVYDSTNQSMTFFRDTPGKYTDGQVSGTKTYYTGFEDITGSTNPSWYDSDSDRQKNTIKTVVFKDKISPKTCYDWFKRADALTSITRLDKLNTSAVTNMYSMFSSCSSLTSLDLSSFNTKNVTSMSNMFWNCSSLTSLDLSGFNTENVTNMYSMFSSCSSLTSLDLSSFNTENVTNMYSMFSSCSSLTSLDLSSFNTENVTDMYSMFWNCSSLTSLDLSGFNTENVTNMSYMFYYCSSLTSLDLSGFNTENVTNMSYMFYYCSSLTSLDLSGFNTENVTNMSYMFYSCSNLKTIYASFLFTTNAVRASTDMFVDCYSLVGGAGTTYNEDYKDKTYARIDGGASNPGYFTEKDPYLTVYMWKRTA